jgi:hypothetical protein
MHAAIFAVEQREEMSRVAAIALDAAELHFVERLIDRGELPHLGNVRARSARYELNSEGLYRTTLLWEAFLAGREDVGHQAAGGFAFAPDSYAAFYVGAHGTVPFYERASGIVPIALDVPHLSLSGAGVRVCCWGGHVLASARGSVPRGLLPQIDGYFGAHPAFGADHMHAWHRADYVRRLGDDLVEGARRRVEIAAWLQKRFPDWNLLIVGMSEAHSAGENFGHVLDGAHPLQDLPIAALAHEQLLSVYRALDEAVGRFVAMQSDDVAVLVFALHGMTVNDADIPSQVLLPELLYRAERGRSRLRDVDEEKWRQVGCPPVVPKSTETWKQHVRARWRGVRPGGASVLHRVGRRLLPQALRKGLRPVDGSVPSWYRQAWPKLRAFLLPTFADAQVRINLHGRERHGVVSLEDYRRACSEVMDLLRSCRDARTGRPAVLDVTLTRAGDPRDPAAPEADLLVRCLPGVDAIVHPDLGTIGPFPFRRTGGHSPNGFAWLSGPGIEPGDRGTRPARDVPPTILSLLGRTATPDVDGTSFLSSSR